MDGFSISPDAVRQMVQNSGSFGTLESVTEAQKQAEETAIQVQPSERSDTAADVGKNVDIAT